MAGICGPQCPHRTTLLRVSATSKAIPELDVRPQQRPTLKEQVLVPRAPGPVVHTHAGVTACQLCRAPGFQGNLITLAPLSIFKDFQMTEMRPDNAFHFFLLVYLATNC